MEVFDIVRIDADYFDPVCAGREGIVLGYSQAGGRCFHVVSVGSEKVVVPSSSLTATGDRAEAEFDHSVLFVNDGCQRF
ncbi:hypothetical protein [Salininema proteolyticum]|uniref:Uncharacterized protein n=1 Tax=Salininema proteolyticum TaxID=1607685 RepID=A0ABV8TT27_9ACTN